MVGVGVDTLELNFYDVAFNPFFMFAFEKARDAACELRDQGLQSKDAEQHLEVGGVVLRVPAGGRRSYWGLADCDDFQIVLTHGVPATGSQQPPVRIELKASCLWREGWLSAARRAREWVRMHVLVGTEEFREQVSRLDMAVDFQGWMPAVADLARVVKRTEHPMMKLAADGEHVQSAYWGQRTSKGIYARLYHKDREARKNHKRWFEDVWARSVSYDPEQPVYRLEFQLRREALKSFERRDGSRPVETIEDLPLAVSSLWQYLTSSWLRLTAPSETDTNRWRAPLDPVWVALQTVDWGEQPVEVVRVKRPEARFEQLLPQTVGTGLAMLAAQVLAGKAQRPETDQEVMAELVRTLRTLGYFVPRARRGARQSTLLDDFDKKLRTLQPAFQAETATAAEEAS